MNENERDEYDFNTYAIGYADSFGVVIDGGVTNVEYDLKQVQEQGFARYRFDGESGGIGGKNVYHRTDDLRLGADIQIAIADDVLDTIDIRVFGFVVPDYMLGKFIRQFPDREVYRER